MFSSEKKRTLKSSLHTEEEEEEEEEAESEFD